MVLEINNNNIIPRVKNLIQTNQAMTVATASGNTAWAAPVYYVNKRACFYFFSNPATRHVEESLASGQAACTIYDDDKSWENLLGLQMSGSIQIVTNRMNASKAILAYVKKFPVVKTFFPNIKNAALNNFIRQFHANLYCFIPEFILFMDNSVHFGFRTEITKESLFK
jgi:uncharacterized protein YhbP (UPF0306 family)